MQVDCGYVGINQQICQTKGCCWNPSSNQGVPWCYYPAGATTTCFKYNPSLSTPFSDAEVAEMRGYMMANINIQGKGGIVAAPDYNTPGGSYYFHWHRCVTLRCMLNHASTCGPELRLHNPTQLLCAPTLLPASLLPAATRR